VLALGGKITGTLHEDLCTFMIAKLFLVCEMFQTKIVEGNTTSVNFSKHFLKETNKCCVLSIALCSAETWTLRTVDRKHLESFKMWCWRRIEISWTDHVRTEEVLLTVKEHRKILHEINKRKVTWVGHI
jgi:hypothetical protein